MLARFRYLVCLPSSERLEVAREVQPLAYASTTVGKLGSAARVDERENKLEIEMCEMKEGRDLPTLLLHL